MVVELVENIKEFTGTNAKEMSFIFVCLNLLNETSELTTFCVCIYYVRM
jgi:hypothetical protein